MRDVSRKKFRVFFSFEPRKNFARDLRDRPQTPETFVTAREQSGFGPDELHAPFSEENHVVLRGGMMPHFAVHRGRDEDRRGCDEKRRRE